MVYYICTFLSRADARDAVIQSLDPVTHTHARAGTDSAHLQPARPVSEALAPACSVQVQLASSRDTERGGGRWRASAPPETASVRVGL